MADKIGDAYVLISANIAEFQKRMGRVQATLKTTGDAFARAGRKLTMRVTLPILALGGVVTKLGLDFAKGLEYANTMMKLSESEMVLFKKSVLDLSDKYGKSAADIASAAYPVASVLHTTGQETIKILEATALAAKAGKITTVAATDAVVRMMSIYGIEAKDTMTLVDTLAATVKAGNANWGDLAHVLPRVAGIAKPLGISIQELGAAFAVVSSKAGSSEEAGTALLTLFLAFMKPTKEMEKALVQIGRMLGFQGKMTAQAMFKSDKFLRVMGLLANQYGEDALALGELIPRVRGLIGATAVMATEGLTLADAMEMVKDSTGEARKQIDAGRGPAERFTEAMNQMRNAGLRMFDSVLPYFMEIVEKLEKLARWMSSLTVGQKKLIVATLAWAAVIGPVLSLIGGMSKGLQALVIATGKTTRGMAALITMTKAYAVAHGALAAVGIAAFWTAIAAVVVIVTKKLFEMRKAIDELIGTQDALAWQSDKMEKEFGTRSAARLRRMRLEKRSLKESTEATEDLGDATETTGYQADKAGDHFIGFADLAKRFQEAILAGAELMPEVAGAPVVAAPGGLPGIPAIPGAVPVAAKADPAIRQREREIELLNRIEINTKQPAMVFG